MPLPVEVSAGANALDAPRWHRRYLGAYGAALPVNLGPGGDLTLETPTPHCYRIYNINFSNTSALWAGEKIKAGSINQGDPTTVIDPYGKRPTEIGLIGAWARTSILDVTMQFMAFTGLTANDRAGFGLGHSATQTMAATPIYQGCAMWAQLDTLTWFLFLGRGAGAGGVVQLAGAPPPAGTTGFHCRLVYIPGQFVSASIDGVEYARITNNNFFPVPNSNADWGMNIFDQNGLVDSDWDVRFHNGYCDTLY